VHRIHNFNAGPAALPLAVLERIQAEFLDFKGSGMSVTEISHRSPVFDEVIDEAVSRTRSLLGLGDDFDVLFVQGGASLQFCMIPMNFSVEGKPLDYVDTGTWSTKAIKEARLQGREVRVLASSEDRNFSYIPWGFEEDGLGSYLHITSNNTIKGTQWPRFPDAKGVPLISDMSSDIMSRPIDPEPFGMIYAGAQKNIGPAGSALVIVRKDLLERVPGDIPTMLRYTTFSEKNSMFNTPACFVIYTVSLVLRWLEEEIGGLAKMEGLNREKAELLYGAIDGSGFYRGTADEDSRSLMNVTFRLPNEELEGRFVKEAAAEGLGGLKGHRSVGGCRASIYNATGLDAVKALVAFMSEFERKNG
jgi:phosphoserine aminotransferase